ncbi:MAG: putative Na+/H+ antiporter [Desulfobacteraceae bacterium]
MVKNPVACATLILCCIIGATCCLSGDLFAASPPSAGDKAFPRGLESYDDGHIESIGSILMHRIRQEPFNLFASLIFLMAIVHTFLTARFMAVAHRWEHAHEEKIRKGEADRESVSHGAELFHFLGEVEAVFGIWAAALVLAIVFFYDWGTAVNYISYGVNFTEALFVVVIMTLAATRPILRLSDRIIRKIAHWMGGSLTARWLTTLTIGPILGSFITEPAAMTISALVLAKNLYELEPSLKFKYATLGLLFVNISVGGTLTHFAAPPVLMVAAQWKWTTLHMLTHFGWKAVVGILLSNGLYLLFFRKEIKSLEEKFSLVSLKEEIQENYVRRSDMDAMFDRMAKESSQKAGTRQSMESALAKVEAEVESQLKEHYFPKLLEKGVAPDLIQQAFKKRFEEVKLRQMRRAFPALLPSKLRGPFVDPDWDKRDDNVPAWVTVVHVLFMAWTILNAHHPELFIPGILFFIGFAQVTEPFQNRINLKAPILVGFFLGGLVIHGGVQGWWIAPILGNLAELPLMLGATVLTAFNDNAAITFLSTLVPGFTDSLKYAVVAGAVAGGGLTIIANAPNPAGVSILKTFFNDEISPLGILAGALVPTMIMLLMFLFL